MSGTGGLAETSVAARTDAGMLALWNPARFADITSYQAWERALLDEQDIARRVPPATWRRSTSEPTEHSRSRSARAHPGPSP